MAPLTFTTKSLEPVPNDTIRKTWDPYTSINFGGTNIGKPKTSKLPTISKLGGTYKHMKNIFVMYPNFHQLKTYSSGRVPIGAWAEVSNNAGRRLSLLQKFNPPCGTNIVDKMVYGEGDYTGPQFPEHLTDDVATNCAGGSGLTFNEYPTTKEDNFINKKDAFTTKQCFYGNRTPPQDKDQCLKGGVQYPVFCQLGDYVATNPKCAQQCSGVRPVGADGAPKATYCNYAYDRLCGKLIGDPVKKDKLNALVRSDKNWIKEPVCMNYCGTASDKSSELCQQHKLSYCTTGGPFDEDKTSYCSEFCMANEDLCFVDKSIMDKLCPVNSSAPTALCDKYIQKECSNTTALPSERCFNFCKSNPELCMDTLKEFCEGKQNRLDEPVDGLPQKKYSDYCGCIQDISEYDKYKTSVIESLISRKLRIALGNDNVESNHCIFPNCNENSIKPHLQPCKNNCLEQVFKGYNFTDFNNEHILECDEFDEIVDEPAAPPPITEPVVINEEIPVFLETIPEEPEIPDEFLLPEIPTGPDTPVSDEPEPLVSETPGLESSSLEEPPASTLAATPPVTSVISPLSSDEEPVPDGVGTHPESQPAPITSEAPPSLPPVTKPPDFTFTGEEEIIEDTITAPSSSEEVVFTSGTGTRTQSEVIEGGGSESFSLNIGEQAGIGIAIVLLIIIGIVIYFFVIRPRL